MLLCRLRSSNLPVGLLAKQNRRWLGQMSILKERIVILGVGWAGFRLAKDLDKDRFDVTVVSPRNHFLFTPLLPSTTVGTLEFRCIQEPIRTVKGIHYHQAHAQSIDLMKKSVSCKCNYDHHESGDVVFDLNYDKLIIAVGTKSNTFGIPGVHSLEEDKLTNTGTNRNSVFFLKQLNHARAIRNRIIECFERASSPFVSSAEKDRLLTFVIVGGGPTSIEFAGELSDFLNSDVTKWYRDLQNDFKVVVVESGDHLLGSFDASLSTYVEKIFKKRHITVLTGAQVKEVQDISVILDSGKKIPFGACIWSTGNAALDFVKKIDAINLNNTNRILINDCLQIEGHSDVFAVGDCAVSSNKPLAMLAQVANQQGIHLAKCLNKGSLVPFDYKFGGAMAQLGAFKAVAQTNGPKLKGFLAFAVWRSAYWTMSVSLANKILIPMYWFKQFFFGRDISKF